MRSLTSAFVKNLRHSGRDGPDKYGDQHGLLLRVMPTGGKQWIWRGTVRGKRVDLGLGGWPYVSLSSARQAAFENRRLAREGGDPRSLPSGQKSPTFAEAAGTVIGIHEPGWKDGGKSANQWRASLRDYAIPRLGNLGVGDISTADVMAALLPIWNEKPETARRVRQRIGAIMKWAVAQGYRPDNPAGDALGAALPKASVAKRHHRALPHAKVADALATVRESRAHWATAAALEYLILTAARSGEVREARWDEVDLDTATWTVPADRMKMQREHRVPLSDRALQILAEASLRTDGSGLIFPSATGRTLSDNTLSKLLRERGIPAVVHGFRSSFRDWCAECSNAPREVSELALAHVNSDRVEAAYMRTDLFERRRGLMQSWADYVSQRGPAG
ncbi:MAG: tyrosine-type recombinase/integrase [bacterium]|nr:tyrosine-type recombinase/integrase [bacterium]